MATRIDPRMGGEFLVRRRPHVATILLFIIVQVAFRMFRAQNRPGLISAIFFLGYGTFRFIGEFFREPDAPFLGPISMGMALSIPVWLGAGLLFAVALKTRK